MKNNSDRFQIVCKNKSEDKGNTYLDLTGGTHYVTIQSVPANAMVYIEHNGNEMFNLNTLGVDSLKTITNSNNNRFFLDSGHVNHPDRVVGNQLAFAEIFIKTAQAGHFSGTSYIRYNLRNKPHV